VLQVGDLVKVNDSAAIPALAGATGIIIRNLGLNPTQVIIGTGEQDSFYYEVDIAAQGSQILLERELILLRKA
jgi:phosphotransferase system IIB component